MCLVSSIVRDVGVINVLINGAGGLGLWTLRLANYYIGAISSESCSRIHLIVADPNVSKTVKLSPFIIAFSLASIGQCCHVVEYIEQVLGVASVFRVSIRHLPRKGI